MKKILYITTLSSTINAFLIPHINMLREKGYQVDCACSINQDIKINELDKDVNIYEIPLNRNPIHPSNVKALKRLIKLQSENEYDIVHVHTPTAGVYGRLLKVKFPKLKTIYTVHGFHFYDGAPMQNWLIYYPIERVMAKLTDTIITMNNEDYERAKKFNIKETYKINGVGVDLCKYNIKNLNKKAIRNKLNLNEDDFVILMIAEVNKNKNHKQMVDAIEILKNKGIDNIKVICAGDGVILDEINDYICEKNLKHNINMLGYRTDINELIAACDIGILMSYREGLPRNIMELMSCKKPIIGTNIRGIRDLIIDGVNGYLVNVSDYKQTSNKIETIYNNKNLLKKMSNNGYKMIKKYDLNVVLDDLLSIFKDKGESI